MNRRSVQRGGASASEPRFFSGLHRRAFVGCPAFRAQKIGALEKCATLAVAVSLWIADGGVCAAQETTIDETYNGNVYGNHKPTGLSIYDEAKASGNTVTIAATIKGSNPTVYGGYSETSDVNDNTVNVNSGTVVDYVYAGYAKNDDANGNKAYINAGEIKQSVYGGRSIGTPSTTTNAATNYNEVYIMGGTVGNRVYGGRSDNGTASNNTVNISGGTVNGEYVCGGWSEKAPVTHNTVEITGGTIKKRVEGGHSASSAAIDNTIKISGNVTLENSSYEIAGGHGKMQGEDASTRNQVIIENVPTTNPIPKNVYGGYADAGNATYNQVKLENAATSKNVHGGFAISGNANYNMVSLANQAKVTGSVYGGRTDTGDANYNTVTLTNQTEITTTGRVYGGYTTTGDANHNTITLTNQAKVTGDQLYGGYTTTGDANNNTITLYNSTAKNVFGGGTSKGTVENNTITLYNATATKVCGGQASASNGIVINNTITLCNSEASYLKGGESAKTITGNTLNLSGANTVKFTVMDFATINIKDAAWGTPVLTLTSAPTPSSYGIRPNTDGTLATINTDNLVFSGGATLSAGQKTVLIQNEPENGSLEANLTGTTYRVGTTQQGTGTASKDGNDLIYTIDSVETQEQTHNTVMGAEVGMAALSAGNDFIGAAAEGLALAANVGADGISSFAQIGGGSIRQETGSHVDVHTWNAIIALGRQNKKERGTFEYGAFFEYGRGNYTTYNGNERGDGSAHYTGGGLLAKWTAKHGLYVEGSVRAGSVHDDARDVLRDANGVPYSYETNAAYLGAHLGVGKEIRFDDIHSLDVYGKYFYNRRNGVSFDAGGHYDLDAVTSSVIRLGARYTVKRDKWSFYGGLAYEHELDGKAAGKADGISIRAADTSGGSVRVEIGATMQPDENSPWSLDLNLSGFAGKKEGFSGGVSVAYMF